MKQVTDGKVWDEHTFAFPVDTVIRLDGGHVETWSARCVVVKKRKSGSRKDDRPKGVRLGVGTVELGRQMKVMGRRRIQPKMKFDKKYILSSKKDKRCSLPVCLCRVVRFSAKSHNLCHFRIFEQTEGSEPLQSAVSAGERFATIWHNRLRKKKRKKVLNELAPNSSANGLHDKKSVD